MVRYPMTDPILEGHGWRIPLPRWALSALAVLAVIGGGLGLWVQFLRPDPHVAELAAAKARLEAEIAEFGVHAFEQPVALEHLEDATGAINVSLLRDFCTMIQRRTPGRGILTQLVPDPARRLTAAIPFAPVEVYRAGFPWLVSGIQRRPQCQSPHEGRPVRWAYGEARDECWVEILWQWAEWVPPS